MRRILVVIGIVVLVGFLIGIPRHGERNEASSSNDTIAEQDSVCEDGDTLGKSLNEIRFADFKDEDWLENEYIRTLRRCLDAYGRGEVEYDGLAPYRDIVKGRFVVADVKEFIGGGLFIHFIFVDHPEYMFVTNVYSTVDTETRKVVRYSVKHFEVEENPYETTTEEILEIIKAHPELKLW